MLPAPAAAYVGPGAGFAFVSTFFIFVVAFLLAGVTLLTWPLRWFVRTIVRGRRRAPGRVRRVVVVGLDGLDPELTDRYLAAGLLPHLDALRQTGAYVRLGTTLPAESPVAWSSFQTGCNPGKHRIYDFLVPNRRSLLPELSSSSVGTASRALRLGRYRIPLGRPRLTVGRRSQPFWKILGDHGVFSSIVRVPLTFPPEPFHGVLLSAMCLPDLAGSQGTYHLYTSDPAEERNLTSGTQLPLARDNGIYRGAFPGPQNSLLVAGGELSIPFRVTTDGTDAAALTVAGQTVPLSKTGDSPWIQLTFRPGLGMKVSGLCKVRLLDTEPHLRLYVSPIQIDPEKPALPISHPFTYSAYLAKTLSPFATLGVAEDTSALNEGIIDEDAFLEQCASIHDEREAMFFDALEKTPRGLVACVFDITDRVQHMFMRYLEDDHPANAGREVEAYRDVIRDTYVQMDDLVGRVVEHLGDDAALLVLSDHGFKPFRRCVDINAWLRDAGYLVLLDGATTTDMLQAVDWARTRAYSVGFGGVYLNLAGREAQGIVAADAVAALTAQLRAGLLALEDPEAGTTPVRAVYDRETAYTGPYVGDAPDLFVGFAPGYRSAWACVTGGLGEAVIEDNVRPWSGDHNMNPADVPGVLFSNLPLRECDAHITDVAPTVLELFGVAAPGYMDGKSLMPAPPAAAAEGGRA